MAAALCESLGRFGCIKQSSLSPTFLNSMLASDTTRLGLTRLQGSLGILHIRILLSKSSPANNLRAQIVDEYVPTKVRKKKNPRKSPKDRCAAIGDGCTT